VIMRGHASHNPRRFKPRICLRLLLTGLLGVAAALLVACGSSGKGLIPTGDAGPLQSDFEAVAQAAESGDGSCAATAEAIRKTEQDFSALPATIDAGLRNTLDRGITNLRSRALALCAQPLAQATSTSATTNTTTSTETTPPTETQTTGTQTTPTVTVPTPGPGGGTPAPGEATPGVGGEANGGAGNEGGAGVGGNEAGGAGGGQEAGK
jgi:hypothetical protein